MYCLLTVRQIKPGTYDQFRAAWEPSSYPAPFVKAYLLRNMEDPDEISSFGFFDVDTAEEVEEMRDNPEFMQIEMDRMSRISEFEMAVKVNSIYEVAEEVVPPGR
jgi:hypothetical protein